MEFTVEVDAEKEPERYEEYYEAFMNNRPLDTGSKIVEIRNTYSYLDNKVHSEFKIRS